MVVGTGEGVLVGRGVAVGRMVGEAVRVAVAVGDSVGVGSLRQGSTNRAAGVAVSTPSGASSLGRLQLEKTSKISKSRNTSPAAMKAHPGSSRFPALVGSGSGEEFGGE
jgi:hypothetical protein